MAVQSVNKNSNVITEKILFIQIGTQEKLVFKPYVSKINNLISPCKGLL